MGEGPNDGVRWLPRVWRASRSMNFKTVKALRLGGERDKLGFETMRLMVSPVYSASFGSFQGKNVHFLKQAKQ